MKPQEYSGGLLDAKVVERLQHPMELDLEAAFRVMQDDAIREFLKAVKEGQTPAEAIGRVDALLGR